MKGSRKVLAEQRSRNTGTVFPTKLTSRQMQELEEILTQQSVQTQAQEQMLEQTRIQEEMLAWAHARAHAQAQIQAQMQAQALAKAHAQAQMHAQMQAEMQAQALAQAEALARAEAMQRGLLLFNIEEMQTRFDKNLADLEEKLFESKMLGSLVSCL